MTPNTRVQFVTFETVLSAEPFIKRWKEYKRSSKSDAAVTIQQSNHKGSFRYIAQHRFTNEEVQFVFTKDNRASGVAQEIIKSNKVGGYTMLQAEQLTGSGPDESKVFAFISDPGIDLMIYKDLSPEGRLNIYEPYYLSCKFAYILEYFINNKLAEELVAKLKNPDITDVAIYRECTIPKGLKAPERKEAPFEWPS